MTEARGPLRPRHRWSLWIVGRWPVSIPRFPGGAAPWDPPFVGVVHGVRTPLLRAVCRSPPAPVRAYPRRDPLRADRCPRGFQWGQLDGHVAVPRCAGASPPWPGARSPLPAYLVYILAFPFRGASGPSPGVRPASAASSPRGGNRDIWLILPVVICLSQRLSHACLSISNLYCETANGSLNQLSFI